MSLAGVLGLRDELARFANVCERVLRSNDHKRGWWHLTVGHLLRRLGQERAELARAIRRGASPAEVESEAADVANFAMMIAENYRCEWRGKRDRP
jgi:NTP pyrophosphatase (non-canonical NTP hydrolase)